MEKSRLLRAACGHIIELSFANRKLAPLSRVHSDTPTAAPPPPPSYLAEKQKAR
jgi:hypothetical protein